MKVSKATIVRTFVYIVALVNMTLTVLGKNPLPYPTEDIENAFTILLDCGAGLVGFWKNESYTKEAIISDSQMKANKIIVKQTGGQGVSLATAEELSNGRGDDE